MTDASDDFDALFEQVSAQRAQSLPATAGAAEEFEAAEPAAQTAETESAEEPQAMADAEDEADAAPSSLADKPMYERLGGIVRLLHDSLRELGYDKALNDATNQIVDAQDRLEYVATLTEQAANKVLNTLDEGMPAQDVLSKQAKDMDTRWETLFAGKLSVDEFKVLAKDTQKFVGSVSEATEKEKARLLEIMMAQDFQDITGQLIKKVVAITKTVEHELAELLRDNAPASVKEKINKPTVLMQGPSVPSVALNQDSVDDLLADLGF